MRSLRPMWLRSLPYHAIYRYFDTYAWSMHFEIACILRERDCGFVLPGGALNSRERRGR